MGKKLTKHQLSHTERDLYFQILETLSANSFSFSKGDLSKTSLKKIIKWISAQFFYFITHTVTLNSFWDSVGTKLYECQAN